MGTSSNLISSPAEDRATGQGVTVWSQMIPSVQGSEAFLLKGAVAGLPGVCVGFSFLLWLLALLS